MLFGTSWCLSVPQQFMRNSDYDETFHNHMKSANSSFCGLLSDIRFCFVFYRSEIITIGAYLYSCMKHS